MQCWKTNFPNCQWWTKILFYLIIPVRLDMDLKNTKNIDLVQQLTSFDWRTMISIFYNLQFYLPFVCFSHHQSLSFAHFGADWNAKTMIEQRKKGRKKNCSEIQFTIQCLPGCFINKCGSKWISVCIYGYILPLFIPIPAMVLLYWA